MTDHKEKSSDSKKTSKDSSAELADRLVKTMAENLAEANKLDSEELDHREDEKNKRLAIT